MSGGHAPQASSSPGTVDPKLRSLSFWSNEDPLCVLSVFSIHPMSFWGTGRVTSDFPGLARERRQGDDADVFQVYASGASGNVTTGKYNDGRREIRDILTDRLYAGMRDAFDTTRRFPLDHVRFSTASVDLAVRDTPGFTAEDLTQALSDSDPIKQGLGAMGLSWLKRVGERRSLEFPMIDFGSAQLLLLPGETYVEYQLFAQSQRPDSFVVVMGYGDAAAGYIPIERAWAESDENLDIWCWIQPGAQPIVEGAIASLLVPGDR